MNRKKRAVLGGASVTSLSDTQGAGKVGVCTLVLDLQSYAQELRTLKRRKAVKCDNNTVSNVYTDVGMPSRSA